MFPDVDANKVFIEWVHGDIAQVNYEYRMRYNIRPKWLSCPTLDSLSNGWR